jgi:(1->4)-alpha-D-glucan 1-alpha-D-glucosylmutase
MWDLSLVDPDNRRPVDFAGRVRQLRALRRQERSGLRVACASVLRQWQDGVIKLHATQTALSWRTREQDLFRDGEYLPLRVTGPRAVHVSAFARRSGGRWAICCVPRLPARLLPAATPERDANAWRGTLLVLPQRAPGRWLELLSHEEVSAVGAGPSAPTLAMDTVFRAVPFALLSAHAGSSPATP